jgi:hypothetical protein
MKRLLILFAFISLCLHSQARDLTKQFPLFFHVKITDPIKTSRQEVFVFISESSLPKDFNTKAFVVLDKDKKIANQFNLLRVINVVTRKRLASTV